MLRTSLPFLSVCFVMLLYPTALQAQSLPVIYDTIATSCLRLVVGSNGNIGHMGQGKVNMDYWDFGDCDTVDSIPGETDVYLFDGSPIIIDRKDDTTVVGSWSIFGEGPDSTYGFKPVIDTIPPIFAHSNVTTSTYQCIEPGQMLTSDSSLAVEITWWAPHTGDSCNFIIRRMRLFQVDDKSHFRLTIGEVIDWDVPSDSGHFNSSGMDISSALIYQRGYEYISEPWKECQDNDRRAGGSALLVTDYRWEPCCVRFDHQYGAFTAPADSFRDYSGRLILDEIFPRMSSPGYPPYQTPADMYSAATYLFDHELQIQDTITNYAVLTSLKNGTYADIQATIGKAREWYKNNLYGPICMDCCQCDRGNIDGDTWDNVDISDLSAMVDFLFFGGSISTCFTESDVDRSESVDIADLQLLIDHLFFGGALPAC